MWVAKLKIFHSDCLIIPRAKRFNVAMFCYPISEFNRKGKIYFTSVNTLQGSEKNKTEFLRDLEKDKRVNKIERNNDLFFMLDSRKPSTKHLRGYRESEIFFIKPVVVKNGFEYWEIASWDKQSLVDFYKHAKANRHTELLKLKQETLSDVYIPNVMQHLTEKQKQAIELAYQNGYYEYPKKTELRKLAQKMRVSLATFQEHLKKAENKMMSAMIERVIGKQAE